jgi:hypothetical protein
MWYIVKEFVFRNGYRASANEHTRISNAWSQDDDQPISATEGYITSPQSEIHSKCSNVTA